jgi:hypothetical protein
MTPSEAVEAVTLGVSLALNVICAACFLRHWLGRQMRARWLAKSSDAYTIIPLPSRCTCCPEHGLGIRTALEVRPADSRQPNSSVANEETQ